MHLHATPRAKRATAAILALAAATAALLLLTYGGGERASASAAGASASGSKTVSINHFAYTPKTLSVATGTRVVFSNASKVKHTATLQGSFDTGKIAPGAAVAVRFTARGTYAYHCTIHPEMHGKIIVG